jgi:colanic acid/amylovoran biosynthesis glycosyltransferase
MSAATGEMPVVVVYRHQLFRLSENWIVAQTRALRRFTPVFAGRLRQGPAPEGARFVTLEDAPLTERARQVLLRDPRPLARRLAPLRPALIHAHFGVEGVYAAPLAARLRIPLLVNFHGFDATLTAGALLRSCRPSWIHFLLGRARLPRQAAAILCTSDFLRAELEARGYPPACLRTHYLGVDTERLRPGPPENRRPGLVVHAARLVPFKGTAVLIDAFRRVAAQAPRAELVVIGAGPERARCEALAGALVASGRVRFLGAIPNPEVLDWMSRAALLCQPSLRAPDGHREGLGVVLLEAAAVGVPAIVSRSGGMPEAVEDGRTGYVVEEGDAAGLAERILRLIARDEDAVAMGRAARARVVERFDLTRQTAALEDLYERLL